jgi:hypothetical protein
MTVQGDQQSVTVTKVIKCALSDTIKMGFVTGGVGSVATGFLVGLPNCFMTISQIGT